VKSEVVEVWPDISGLRLFRNAASELDVRKGKPMTEADGESQPIWNKKGLYSE
jgi:hypothetical protein